MRRFVLFRPGALGDTLVCAPVVQALRRRYPDTRIEYLSERHPNPTIVTSQEAVSLISGIDTVHLYDPASDGWSRVRELRAVLNPGVGDMLVYLCYTRLSSREVLRDWLFFKLVGFPRSIGFKVALGDAVRGGVSQPNESEYARLFRILSGSGMEPDLDLSCCLRTDADWAQRFWEQHSLHGASVVAVCPGSKMQSKRWPARRYAEALSILGKDPNCIFVLIGNESDRPLAGQISRESSARVISAIGATLLQTSGILSRVQLYLGNDTGPMHMAALHGIPCVVIFSARDRAGKWHPPGDHHVFLRADAPCAGCMLKECFSEPALCLFDVPVERVVEAARRALKLEMVPATVVIS